MWKKQPYSIDAGFFYIFLLQLMHLLIEVFERVSFYMQLIFLISLD